MVAKWILIAIVMVVAEFLTPLRQMGCNVGPQIGQNCGSTSLVTINGFTIAPWPPVAGVTAEIIVCTTWTQDIYLQEIAEGTCFNNMFWNYTPYNFDNYFTAGVETEFGFFYTYPTAPGSYLANFQFVVNGQHANCWQFNFVLQ